MKNSVAVLGAGITGLTAAYFISRHGGHPMLIERDSQPGGLAKTVSHNGFRFDLGGHRFLTQNTELEEFVKRLLNHRYLVVNRTSNIYLNNQYIKYPLQPWDAFQKVGYRQSVSFILDYLLQKCRCSSKTPDSLEEWVVQQFGRSLYEVFFKGYSEKVWGMDCRRIDADWIAQRIQNLNLAKAIKSALNKRLSRQFATLTDKFLYPADGIGSITDNLNAALDDSMLQLNASIERVFHNGRRITALSYRQDNIKVIVNPDRIISTIPLAVLVHKLRPRPPGEILDAANQLRSRDLVLVTLMVNRNQVSRDSWVYFPEKQVPFGRIHEPKNWSNEMAPEGKTAVVTEHFCFRGDNTWNAPDDQLVQRTVTSMTNLGFIEENELLDAIVTRIPNAYPLFEIGYRRQCEKLIRYLGQFENLDLAGRTGAFRYYNMDQAMLSGIEAAEQVLGEKIQLANYGLPLKTRTQPGGFNEMCPDYSGVAP